MSSRAPQLPPANLARRLETDPAGLAEDLRRIIAADPLNAGAQRLLGRTLRRLGRDAEASQAEMAAIRLAARDPAMVAIAEALLANDLPRAEPLLRQRLREQPTDVAAIRLMAELAARIGRLPDAETLLRRALDLARSA